MPSLVRLKVRRKSHAAEAGHWETFEIPYQENMNVISTLMEVRKAPTTVEGKTVAPPAWEAACLEEVCGSCTMVINGHVRQACTALVEDVARAKGDALEISLEPMSKFPLVRDLIVDRSRMFQSLAQVQAWVPIDGSYDLGAATAQDDAVRQFRYSLSRCMTCGCCLEACPQFNDHSPFIGPAAIGQALLFNRHPVGKTLEGERLDVLSSEQGVTGCGNAQNCVKVCPKGVPLTRAIAEINRDTTRHRLRKWIGLPS
ncbi:MAG: succinate dehydrogenase iron-sulfur subunit [Fimbriimonas ginsengisoli]|uniref:succinate dehydrogenase n=1 Tax=Fimbriimonas ginsengisoli TaxID=1005039 RepID=A0A931PUJ0_FIMGI|nr:succinate dehydrogenase iron-sulfur subunit [Fimbriimonas ginsengisoli]MBI3721176.1 succinate dehydrogenase iron-sulfur subunit [Fimbriimonas ginsengisoli]